jgi:hypothetical protein
VLGLLERQSGKGSYVKEFYVGHACAEKKKSGGDLCLGGGI